MPKTRNDEIYEMGVKDGLESVFLDDIADIINVRWGLPFTEEEWEIYNEGYTWGQQHRYEHREKEREVKEKAQKEQETRKEAQKGREEKEREAQDETQEEQEQNEREESKGSSSGGSGGGGPDIGVWGAVACVIGIFVFLVIVEQCIWRFGFNVSSRSGFSVKMQEHLADHSLAKSENNFYSVDIGSKKIEKFIEGSHLTFSPDGKQIAFLRRGWLDKNNTACVANSDGSNMRITKIQGRPYCWWPDSRNIVSVYNGNIFEKKSFFSLYDVQRNNFSSVSFPVSGEILNFIVSSDKKIAFVVQTEETKEKILYIFQGIESYRPPAKILSGRCIILINWSPNGKSLAIFRDGYTDILGFNGDKTIKVAHQQVFLSWSPDQSGVVVASSIESIYLFRVGEDTKAHFLAVGNDPKWSPDGKKIAWTIADTLCVKDISKNISDIMFDIRVSDFVWAPDSKRIFFSRSGKS